MVVVMEERASEEQIQRVVAQLVQMGFDVHRSTGSLRTVIGAVGGAGKHEPGLLEVLDGVQEVMRITRTIRDGSFFKNPVLLGAFDHAKKSGGSVHLLGLFSDGRVHSDMDHAFAILELCRKAEFPADRFFVHVITDGRDTSPTSGLGFVQQTEAKLHELGAGRIASVIGRYYAMDRDNRWDRVEKAYRLLTQGAAKVAANPADHQARIDLVVEKRVDFENLIGKHDAFFANLLLQCFHCGIPRCSKGGHGPGRGKG